jgi:hypothetical protein
MVKYFFRIEGEIDMGSGGDKMLFIINDHINRTISYLQGVAMPQGQVSPGPQTAVEEIEIGRLYDDDEMKKKRSHDEYMRSLSLTD